MTKGTTALLTAALAAAGSALGEAQPHEPQGWAAAHCSADAVRARHWSYVDETTLEGLFALASMERECEAAAAASAEPEPELVYDRPWTAFCSEAALRGRHPNTDFNLLLDLHEECRGALQAAADAGQELRLCRYSSVSECDPDRGCAARAVCSGTRRALARDSAAGLGNTTSWLHRQEWRRSMADGPAMRRTGLRPD